MALFLQPLLIAASIFPIELVFPLAAFHIICICLTLTFMPKTPELIEHMRQEPYTPYGMPITLQVFVALISFIWVRSARDTKGYREQGPRRNALASLVFNEKQRVRPKAVQPSTNA